MTSGGGPRNVLLDTHTLLWLVATPEQLRPEIREMLSNRKCAIWVSAASAWEIAIKTKLGRLDGEILLSAWSEILGDMAAGELSIDAQDAILAGRLPWEHRDPFDRVLVAQAVRRNLTVVTRDARILGASLAPTLTA
ncbi:twitching motility protein PilT [Mycolicibacterium chitae]|uniref:PilT domain-containing protein n=1 Tax=Mycolicibacterium chitae TaxID=1792 RepID=A0A448IEE3_MYCCI|nr:type II toxin-antitoxin system VapC family toxin [Mycolicibacterium chitae]MCV7104688.1 type II toxin-antitoxin system VapC family toxin [Mycolicibacterium chitae]BBZ01891.1 twitching motility protein PilT [Mycolicibacterium chitae]VEG50718.1 PilT domain-containing protein [Mycolicibacterium chitae]